MKIYGNRTSGNPRRVAIFLEEKGIDVPFEAVDLMSGAHKTEEFLRKNPAAQVPVLELEDGTHLAETIAICRYFESLHPDPPLFGTDALDQAIVEMWQRRVEFGVNVPVAQYVRHTNPAVKPLEPVQIAAWGQLNRGRAEAGLRIVDQQLAHNEFIAGPRFSVADITVIYGLQGTAVMGGLGIPDDCTHAKRWLASVSQRPSVVATFRNLPSPPPGP